MLTANDLLRVEHGHKRVYLAEGRTREEAPMCAVCFETWPCATSRLVEREADLRDALHRLLACPMCEGKGHVRAMLQVIECECRVEAKRVLQGAKPAFVRVDEPPVED